MKNLITIKIVKLILVLLIIITMFSCQKPPKEGCLDKKADNYNSQSEDNCCCKYHFDVDFKSDTLNVNDYLFYIDGNQVEQRTTLPWNGLFNKTTIYAIYQKSDSSLVIKNVINLQVVKNNIIKF